jgi:predicted small secreted protein
MVIAFSAKHINATNNKHKIVAKIIMNIRNASQIWSINVVRPTFKTFMKIKGDSVVYEIGPKTVEISFLAFCFTVAQEMSHYP